MLLRVFVIFWFFIFCSNGHAFVEVTEPRMLISPYKTRYPQITTLWSINSLPLRPHNYVRSSDHLKYQDLFGNSSIGNLEFSGFIRRKFSIFDCGFGFGLSNGFLRSATYPGSSLAIDIRSLKVRVWMNTLTDEPYFIPFAGLEYWNLQISESDGIGSNITQVPGAIIYQIGFQLLLNPIDPSAATTGLIEFGLQNTHLDISYFMLANKKEELVITPLNGISVGLSLEF
jgi:hypothetical protein